MNWVWSQSDVGGDQITTELIDLNLRSPLNNVLGQGGARARQTGNLTSDNDQTSRNTTVNLT